MASDKGEDLEFRIAATRLSNMFTNGDYKVGVPAGSPLRLALSPTMGPPVRAPLLGASGFHMRLGDDLRRTVVFFGVSDDTPGKGGIACFGTGFFIYYDDGAYLVTARHLVDAIGDAPVVVRINVRGGTSHNVSADPAIEEVRWYYHEDESVDLAMIPFWCPRQFDHIYIDGRRIVDDTVMRVEHIGIGDLTYVVGLFRLMHGSQRNLPIVHSGNIALLPGDERIPVRDWRDPANIRTMLTEAYLVEGHGLQGLSGSPVFVRPSRKIRGAFPKDEWDTSMLVAGNKVALLGMWQGSWDAPPDEVMAAEIPRGARVPVGLGVVVPATKIKEILDSEEVMEHRKTLKQERAKREAQEAAQLD